MTSITNLSASNPQAGRADSASTKLAGDFDQFLSLLTTQLQFQDPLDPLDTNQFTQQLVQFTSVEQSIQQNQNLESLIALSSTQALSSATSFLGETVTADTDVAKLGDKGADWRYNLNATADETKLQIVDSNNRVVRTLDGGTAYGDHSVHWDGLDNNGRVAAPGLYRLQVEAQNSSGTEIAAKVTLTGTIDEIHLENGQPTLLVAGSPVSAAQILSVATAKAS